MNRFCYCLLLRLHPARFRYRYALEMLAIFDETARSASVAPLLADAFVSLLRQWFARPENWREPVPAPVQWTASDGAPSFHLIESGGPPLRALFNGACLSIALFGLASYMIAHGGVRRSVRSLLNSSEDLTVSTTYARPNASGFALPGGDTLAIGNPAPGTVFAPVSADEGPSVWTKLLLVLSHPEDKALEVQSLLAGYSGAYTVGRADGSTFLVLVSVESGQLTVRMGADPPATLAPLSNGRFAALSVTGDPLLFEFTPAPAVRLILHAPRAETN